MEKIMKNVFFVSLCLMLLLSLETRAYSAQGDVLVYYRVDSVNHFVEFDSANGPLYGINYIDKTIISCTSENAILKKCEVDGDILTIEVYSDELPVDSTYIIDLSIQNYEDDYVEFYEFDYSKKTISFDTSMGPNYTIDYENKMILHYSATSAVLKKCEVNGDILTITVYSDELPKDSTYTFDMTVPSYYFNNSGTAEGDTDDVIERYEFNYAEKTISFDTSKGPAYLIDYENKVILDCTSIPGDGGILKKCEVNGDILTITVYSDELPKDSTYNFDMTIPSYPNDVLNPIWEYMIDKTSKVIRFFSRQGQLYTIDYGKKVILDCSATSAVLKKCEVNGDIITITVSSYELPVDRTYTFDMTRYIYPTGFVDNSDFIDRYQFDYAAKTICFDTHYGPEITINYNKKEVLDHTTTAVVLKECEVNGDTLTITVYSTERLVDSTYTFDMTISNYNYNHQVYGTPDFVLPTNTKTIKESAFEGDKMAIAYLPDSCTNIGPYAFKDCWWLIQIRIPANCTISDTAFEGCGTIFLFSAVGSYAETFCKNHSNCVFVEE